MSTPAVNQTVEKFGTGVTSVAKAITISSGSCLEVVVAITASSVSCSSVTDGANTYTLQNNIVDAGFNWRFQTFTTSPLSAGTYTVTANLSGSATALMAISEITGSIGLTQSTAQLQTSPGTSSNAVTSGNVTPASNPTLIHGYCFQYANFYAITDGTGFSSSGTYFASIGANALVTEYQVVSALTPIAATYTIATNNHVITAASAWAAVSGNSLTASYGPFAINGQAVTFTASTSIANLLAFPATYNLTGAFSSSDLNLPAASVNYGYAGQAAQLVPVISPVSFPAGFGSYSIAAQNAVLIEGITPPPAPGSFPNVTGQYYWIATLILQQTGYLVPSSLGYFGTWPITIQWKPSVLPPGVVVSQSVAVGTAGFVPNSPIALTVSEFPIAVEYP